MTKSQLRKKYLARQKSLSRDEIVKRSKIVTNRFFDYFDLTTVRFLHCFISIDKFHEIDTSPLIQRIWEEFPHVRTLVPRVDFHSGALESLTIGEHTRMVRNVWGILEPSHDETVESKLIDIVVVPGLAFDGDGHRVGYGKGLYDHFLNICREDCPKVGLSFFEPVDQIADTYAGDARLDFLITPTKTYSFTNLRSERRQ